MPVYGNLPKKKKENAATIGTIETLDKQKKKNKVYAEIQLLPLSDFAASQTS